MNLSSKHNFHSSSKHKILNLHYAVEEEPNLGVRQGMEDFTIMEHNLTGDGAYSFFCVLDGHGGPTVSKYVKEHYGKLLKSKVETYRQAYTLPNIVRMTIENMENQLKIIGARDCGTTFCGVLVDRANARALCINIGDSRALYLKHVDTPANLSFKFVTAEHKATNEEEAQRVKKGGGVIFNGRLAGNLMITRSLGDFDFKKYGLISAPDIAELDVNQAEAVILASDGIWDVIMPEDICALIKADRMKDLESFNKEIVKSAIQKGSCDNISIITVRF